MVRQSRAESGSSAGGQLEIFEYPASSGLPAWPDWNGWRDAAETDPAEPQSTMHESSERAAAESAAVEQRLAEEKRRSYEAGREQGRKEGRASEREAQTAALAVDEERRREQAASLLASFAAEQERYLRAVEHEVVKLALAVAARILRREAQMDPLLLTGAVRVALGQLARATEVRLLVPAAELEMWTEAIALLPNLSTKPTVVAGDGMRTGDCVLETTLGSVDLGVRAQLNEIERGFFDRTGTHRPKPVAHVAAVDAAETENCA